MTERIEAANVESLLTPDEIAVRLRVKRSWVYSRSADLGAYRLGKYLRFSWPRVLARLEIRNSVLLRKDDSTRRIVPGKNGEIRKSL